MKKKSGGSCDVQTGGDSLLHISKLLIELQWPQMAITLFNYSLPREIFSYLVGQQMSL